MTKLGKYFTLEEMTRSNRAVQMGVANIPSEEEKANLKVLVEKVLDPAREAIGHPVQVTSGFRCRRVNDAIPGSSKTSQHVKGEAADLVAGSLRDNLRLGQIIVAQGQFDQIIFENVGRGNLLPQWIHVSHKRVGKNRGSVLRKTIGVRGYQKVTLKEVLG